MPPYKSGDIVIATCYARYAIRCYDTLYADAFFADMLVAAMIFAAAAMSVRANTAITPVLMLLFFAPLLRH